MTEPVRGFRLDEAAAVNAAGLISLGISFAFLISGRGPDLLGSTPRLFLALLWPIALGAFWLSKRPLVVIVYIGIGGLLLRLAEFPLGGAGSSDVLAGTHEAIETLFHGENPYTHFYERTRPPGQPFPYPPAALLVHLPGHVLAGLRGVQATQVVLSAATFALFVWLGIRLSWVVTLPAMAVYAGVPNLINLTVDGSNDTGVGFALGAALIAVAHARERQPTGRAMLAAGALGGFAVGIKQTAAPIVLLLLVYIWRSVGRPALARYVAGAAGVLLLISVPFVLLGPLAYLKGLLAFVGAHDDVYGWNIWSFAQGMGWTVWEKGPAAVLNLIAIAAATAVAVTRRYRGLAEAGIAGVLLTLIVLLTARWTTYAYFALVVPVVLLLPALALWDTQQMEAGTGERGGAASGSAPVP